MSEDYKVTRNHYPGVKNVTWSDVIEKLGNEFSGKFAKTIYEESFISPTFVTNTGYFPGTIGDAYDEITEGKSMFMHTYTSLGSDAATFGRHNDMEDVLIVQSIGKVLYSFDDGNSYILRPGDSVFIKKEVYHDPVALGPRFTLSLSNPF